MEALPHHLQVKVAAQDEVLLIGSGVRPAEAYLDQLKLWDSTEPVRVCFFGGDAALRIRIRDIAMQWTQVGGQVPLDFGAEPIPPDCTGRGRYQIRVGFEYRGYWSLVGRDSVNLAGQREQSMNFSKFNVAPPPSPEFDRIVLHEFGHAIGFEHEHQNILANCEGDFDWPAVYDYLKGPPNYWDVTRVDFNMRPRQVAAPAASSFDRTSIMLYTFPPEFYVNGEDAECYAPPNYVISDTDAAAMRQLYPADPAQAAALRESALLNYEAFLSDIDLTVAQRSAASLLAAELQGGGGEGWSLASDFPWDWQGVEALVLEGGDLSIQDEM